MGAGGIDSAEAALQFLHAGSGVVQVCSAIQNQDFTVVQDYITGLKTMLYLQARQDLSYWDGQSPPVVYEMRNRIGKGLPKFGPYMEERLKKRSEYFKAQKEVEETTTPTTTITTTPTSTTSTTTTTATTTITVRPAIPTKEKIPTVVSQIGKALPRIGEYNQLNNKQQAVALVNNELCINCGKCYMTCNDSGYQAIKFDAKTHIPTITEDCTGCTLCVSVCPIPDCITMVPREIPYEPGRGVPVGTPAF